MVELPSGEHMTVGPYSNVYSHGPVIFIAEEKAADLYACLDCGFVSEDVREFHYADCKRANNPVNESMRERVEDEGFPEEGGE